MAGVAAGADVGAFFSRPLWCSFFSVCEISYFSHLQRHRLV